MNRYALRAGESLAIQPDAIQRDADGFFLMLGPGTPDNEPMGDVQVVHIRGPLAHFKGDGGDSYEDIMCRVQSALECEPKAIVFRIESPGGVVAGLNETVRMLKERSAKSKVPFLAYVDELASSAAYALCCACEEILAPQSAVIGSVGVISTMISTVKKDQMEGIEFRLITSGARKADGHLHAPITDAAVNAERDRNAKLASQFFALAGKARGMPPKELQSLEAGIYLAKDAKRVGLIDDVMSFDDLIGTLNARTLEGPPPAPPGGNLTQRRAKKAHSDTSPIPALDKRGSAGSSSRADVPKCAITNEEDMGVKLESLIATTEASIAKEEDPKKRARLAAQLAQYQATKVAMESGHDEPDGDEGDDDEDEDESKAKMAAKKAEEARRKAEASKHRAKAAEHKQKAAEYEEKARKAEYYDEEDEDEESEEEEASSSAGATEAAISDHVDSQTSARISVLENKLAQSDKAAAIATALQNREITPAQAKMLGKKAPSWVAEYLETTKGMQVVSTDEGHLVTPRTGGNAGPDKSEVSEIDARIALMGVKDPKQVEQLRNEMIASRRSMQNGAGGRY